MAGTTSVPQLEFTLTGIVAPDESAILAGVQADQNAAFGGNLNPSLSTPQGQLAQSQAAIIGHKNNQFLEFVNDIDPATSSGFMQDAIGRIYFMERLPATSTAVNVICSGKTGTIIPTGALIQDSSKNIYQCTAGGTIPAGGTITLPFAAVQTGPIACPALAITTIYQTIPGWDSVTNSVDGITGTDVESRADFEYRRQQSVAVNARDTLDAVRANVINVPGVTDVYCAENFTDGPVVIDGQTLAPHSLYAAVVGGTDQAVGDAIYEARSTGSNFNGNTSFTIVDNVNYAPPYPTYTGHFTRPAALPIYFALTVQNLSALPNATVEANIKTAIVAAFGGADGGQRARIGSTIVALRYVLPVTQAAQIALLSIFVDDAPAPATPSVYVGIGNTPTIDPNNITVSFV